MDRFERDEYVRQLLDIKFDDDVSYTRAELEAMSDEDLQECHTEETASLPSDGAVEIEACAVCHQLKACPFEDQDGRGAICQDCADAFEEDPDDEEEDDDGEEDDEEDDEDEEEEEEGEDAE